jgi:uncharacterized membrane protein
MRAPTELSDNRDADSGFRLLSSEPAGAANAFEKFDCFGTEPFWNAWLDRNEVKFSLPEGRAKRYLHPTYTHAKGNPYSLLVRVEGSFTAFVVDEAAMVTADNKGAVTDKFQAYCSDGMSEQGHPYSIHLLVDSGPYTGCCTTSTRPSVSP